MRLSARTLLLVGLAALSLTAAGFSGADFTASSSNPGNAFATGDYVPPTIDGAVVVPGTPGAPNDWVKKSGTYTLYVNVSDQAQGSSGIASVKANLTNISGNGNNNVALSPCVSNCTVGATTYGYSVTKTASSTLTDGSKGYTVDATDNAANAATQFNGSVNADSTGPTVTAILENAAGSQATFIKKSTSYYVLANASDSGVGLNAGSIRANLVSLTGNAGDTAVSLVSCGSSGAPSCTVNSVTYSYAVQVTTSGTLTDGAKTAPVSADDLLANTGAGNASATADSTGPTITPIIERADGASTTAVKQSTTYWVLSNVTDAGSGVDTSTIKSDIHNLTGNAGDTAVSLVSCGSSGAPSCTVNSVTYAYAVQFSTGGTLADGATSYSVSASDNLANSSTVSPSVTVDSTPPPNITDFAVIKDTAGGSPNFVGKPQAFNTQKYRVYANVPADTGGSGIASVTADVHNITGNAGDTAVALTSGSFPVPNNTSTTYNYRSAQLTSSASLVDAASLAYTVVSTDNAGNSSTSAGTNATVDNLQPTTPTSGAISTVNNGATAGKAEMGDQLILKYSDLNMDPFLIASGWDGTTTLTNITVNVIDKGGGGSNDGLAVVGTNLSTGNIDMGSTGYITTNNGTVSFTGSSMSISTSAGVATVTITLGTPGAGTLGTVAGTPTASWTPSGSATDKAGNTVATTARTMGTPMF